MRVFFLGGMVMEFPVVHLGQTVGRCTVRDDGLYWQLECECQILSDRVERLYWGQERMGVLERNGGRLICNRRIAKSSVPELSAGFSLSPCDVWSGRLLDTPVQCIKQGDTLLFPYRPEEPCPCEPLICFFEVKDGYWQLPFRWASAGDDPSGA